MFKILSYLFLLLSSGGLAACHHATMDDQVHTTESSEKFQLSASPATADGYPVEIYRGNFIQADGRSFPIPSGNFLEGSWGQSGTIASLGEAEQAVPDSLEILWFSYPEDTFYEGHFQLPRKHMHELLKQGYWNTATGKQETYYNLTVCVLPKGGVVLWLTGQNQVLLGRFQAHKTAFDFKQFNAGASRAEIVQDERARLTLEVKQQLATNTLSSQKWDAYLQRYPWQLAFNQPVRLTTYSINYLNAEGTSFPLTPDLAPYAQVVLAPSPKAVPKDLALTVQAQHGAYYKIWVDSLDETETMRAFQTLRQLRPQSPLTFLVELSKDFQKGTIHLKNDAREILIAKARIRIISVD
jgi:hypothetical protein